MTPQQIIEREKNTSPLQRNSTAPIPTAHPTIAVIGLGYVGLPLAILAASRGNRVIGFDIDKKKIERLTRKEVDFLSEDELALFKRTTTLSTTSNEADLDEATVFIVCVPTPVYEDSHLPDLGPLEGACAVVGRHLREDSLVVIESTVSPGVCENTALPTLEKASGLTRDAFYFAHCPERINPGDRGWNVSTIPRVVGGYTKEAARRTMNLYASLINAELFEMNSIKEAEAVKMVENAFRDINIAFVNELAISFDRAGIDLVHVIRAASTKPFGYMPFLPGCGVGGHCIPVDPYYLIRYGHENGFEHRFLITARDINNRMPLYTVDAVEKMLSEQKKELRGSVVTLLGIAYKRDIPDVRESPAVKIRDTLIERGAIVRVYDPYVPAHSTTPYLSKALQGADVALLATDHSIFRLLTPGDFKKYGVTTIIDGRNCLDKKAFIESGMRYHGIGH